MGFLTLFKKEVKTELPKAELVVVSSSSKYEGDGAVKGRQVALWNPPVKLDEGGRTMYGISKELVANYLVAATEALADTDLGPCLVEWGQQEGRFATVNLKVQSWGAEFDILIPVSVISQEVADAFEHYRSGLADKLRELHKGHQDLTKANNSIKRAANRIERLRDDVVPHFNAAEFLFIQTQLIKAQVLSALVPVSKHEPENVFDEFVVIEN